MRCGYCDFNTYTNLGDVQETYADVVIGEIQQSIVSWTNPPQIETVFFGGGTPTLLSADDLVRILQALDHTYGLKPGAEVTTEANPDSVTVDSLRALHRGGFTRVSFGVQSAVPHVLATLDRTHNPANVTQAVAAAREAGFEHISIDLIYGTPGETLEDWRVSVETALALNTDHISAYALIVEDGTALARRIARGEIEQPDDDLMAEKYELADDLFTQAGLEWYEISNWRKNPAAGCAHNELYWRSDDWWGFGPGSHSHVDGLRWWNSKNPRGYHLDGYEVLSQTEQNLEQVMLAIRMRQGLDARRVDPVIAQDLSVAGLIDLGDHLVLTRKGRLLADAVVRALTG